MDESPAHTTAQVTHRGSYARPKLRTTCSSKIKKELQKIRLTWEEAKPVALES